MLQTVEGVNGGQIMANSGIPTTPKRFHNWLEKQKGDLPAGLYSLGVVYRACLGTIAMNKSNPDALATAKRINATAMTEFMSAYAEWRGK